jgi:hypothetical protein
MARGLLLRDRDRDPLPALGSASAEYFTSTAGLLAVLRCCGAAVLRCCGAAVLRCCGAAVLHGAAVLRKTALLFAAEYANRLCGDCAVIASRWSRSTAQRLCSHGCRDALGHNFRYTRLAIVHNHTFVSLAVGQS